LKATLEAIKLGQAYEASQLPRSATNVLSGLDLKPISMKASPSQQGKAVPVGLGAIMAKRKAQSWIKKAHSGDRVGKLNTKLLAHGATKMSLVSTADRASNLQEKLLLHQTKTSKASIGTRHWKDVSRNIALERVVAFRGFTQHTSQESDLDLQKQELSTANVSHPRIAVQTTESLEAPGMATQTMPSLEEVPNSYAMATQTTDAKPAARPPERAVSSQTGASLEMLLKKAPWKRFQTEQTVQAEVHEMPRINIQSESELQESPSQSS
jgi:hypothetical protein